MNHKVASLSSDIDNAIDVLARVTITAREKRAEGETTYSFADIANRVAQPFATARDAIKTNLVEPLFKQYTDQAMKHLGWGLTGAGAGLGAGLLSQYLRPKDKRKYFTGILQGGLIGGALGTGGSLLHSNIGALGDLYKPTERQQREHVEQAIEDAANWAQAGPGMPTDSLRHLNEFNISMDDSIRLAEMRQRYGDYAGTRVWLESMSRPITSVDQNTGETNRHIQSFRLPSNFNLKPEEQALLRPYSIQHRYLQPLGFDNPQEILQAAQQDAASGNTQARDAFINRVMESYSGDQPSRYLRTVTDGTNTQQVPWQRDRLVQDWSKIVDKLKREDRLYQFFDPYSNPQSNPQVLALLNRYLNTGPLSDVQRQIGSPGGWNWATNNPVARFDRMLRQFGRGEVSSGLHTGTYGGLGTAGIWGAESPNEGLIREMARWSTPRIDLSENDLNPQTSPYTAAFQAGFNPVEILEAYRGGLPAQQQFIQRAVEDGRTRLQGDQQVPWTAEELADELPNIINATRQVAYPNANTVMGINLENLPAPTTGSISRDLLLASAAADTAITLSATTIDAVRSGLGTNPRDITYALLANELPPEIVANVGQDNINAMRQVVMREGERGVVRMMRAAEDARRAGSATFQLPSYNSTFNYGNTLSSLGDQARSTLNAARSTPQPRLATLQSNIHQQLANVIEQNPSRMFTIGGRSMTVPQILELRSDPQRFGDVVRAAVAQLQPDELANAARNVQGDISQLSRFSNEIDNVVLASSPGYGGGGPLSQADVNARMTGWTTRGFESGLVNPPTAQDVRAGLRGLVQTQYSNRADVARILEAIDNLDEPTLRNYGELLRRAQQQNTGDTGGRAARGGGLRGQNLNIPYSVDEVAYQITPSDFAELNRPESIPGAHGSDVLPSAEFKNRLVARLRTENILPESVIRNIERLDDTAIASAVDDYIAGVRSMSSNRPANLRLQVNTPQNLPIPVEQASGYIPRVGISGDDVARMATGTAPTISSEFRANLPSTLAEAQSQISSGAIPQARLTQLQGTVDIVDDIYRQISSTGGALAGAPEAELNIIRRMRPDDAKNLIYRALRGEQSLAVTVEGQLVELGHLKKMIDAGRGMRWRPGPMLRQFALGGTGTSLGDNLGLLPASARNTAWRGTSAGRSSLGNVGMQTGRFLRFMPRAGTFVLPLLAASAYMEGGAPRRNLGRYLVERGY